MIDGELKNQWIWIVVNDPQILKTFK
jgi:hypothetical protein